MKTQKKSFRKKALLSSVSMLLVSTVAVGSATFAWFTSNKSVTADTMKVKASAAQGLQITKDYGATWGSAVSFSDPGAAKRTISPVSLAYSTDVGGTPTLDKLGTPYYPAKAEEDGPLYLDGKNATDTFKDNSAKFDTWTRAAFPTFPASLTGDAFVKSDNFVAYKVGIKSTGAEIDKPITGSINYTSKTNQEYVRVAVLENETTQFTVNNDGTVTSYNVGATAWDTNPVKQVYGNGPDTYAYVGGNDKLAEQADPATTSATKFTVGTLPEKTTKWYTVLIWFEGQDTECKDINQSLEYTNIEINFSYN